MINKTTLKEKQMIKTKSLVVLTTAFISMNSFALVCQTDMIRGNGNIFNAYFGEGFSEQEACKEARKECSKALRLGQRSGQFQNASCELVGLVGSDTNPDPIPYPTPEPIPTPNPYPTPVGNYDYQLNQIERDYSNGGWQRRQAAIAELTRFPAPRALSIALRAMGDSDSDVRSTAVRVLRELPRQMDLAYQAMEILNIVTPTLKSGSWTVRQASAKLIGMLQTAQGVIPLLGSLSDSDTDVRSAASNSINTLKQSQDFRQVMRSNKNVFEQILRTGGWITRQMVVRLIGESRINRYIDTVVAAMGDSDSDVRNAAQNAIRSITESGNFTNLNINLIDELGQLSTASSWTVRQQAVFALGETRNYAARTYIIRALDDRDSDVRNAARDALRKI
jgi:HEAT repeat protein